MIALTLTCLFEGGVIGFAVTFVAQLLGLDGQSSANLGIVAETSWVGSVVVYVLRQRRCAFLRIVILHRAFTTPLATLCNLGCGGRPFRKHQTKIQNSGNYIPQRLCALVCPLLR
jgi:hypothetical protein